MSDAFDRNRDRYYELTRHQHDIKVEFELYDDVTVHMAYGTCRCGWTGRYRYLDQYDPNTDTLYYAATAAEEDAEAHAEGQLR